MALEVQPEEKNVSFEENSDKAKSETTNTNVQEKEKNENGKRKLRKTRPGASKPRVKCNIPELKDKIFDCTGYKQAEDYKSQKKLWKAIYRSIVSMVQMCVSVWKI